MERGVRPTRVDGTGLMNPTRATCPKCQGRRRVAVEAGRENGRRRYVTLDCEVCLGRGTVAREEAAMLKAPQAQRRTG